MKQFDYTIQEAVGIHARPAGLLVKEVKKYKSTVTVIKGDKSSNALKLMALMGMGVKCGDTVTVTVEGEDEDTAAPALERAFVIESFCLRHLPQQGPYPALGQAAAFCFLLHLVV